MSVQSPASVPNPGSVGAPSPAPLNPAEEQAYLDKVCNELDLPKQHVSLKLFQESQVDENFT